MPLTAPTALDLIGPRQPRGIALMIAAPTANAVTRLTDHLNDTLWPPLESSGTITGFRYRVAKPADLDGDGGYRSAEALAWRIVRVEIDLPAYRAWVGNAPGDTGPVSPDDVETVARQVIGALAIHHPDIVVGWFEHPGLTDDTLFDRLFTHLDEAIEPSFGSTFDGWHWLLLALVRRLTPVTGVVKSSELLGNPMSREELAHAYLSEKQTTEQVAGQMAGGKSWLPQDALLHRFADAFLEASDARGRSAAADHRFLSAHCSRYRRAVHTGGVDHLGRAQGSDLIDTFSPTLTGGARTAATNALVALTGKPKKQVASAISDRALGRLERNPRATSVRCVARGFAGAHQIGDSVGPDRSRPIGEAIITALGLLESGPDRPFGRRTCGTVINDDDPTQRSWFVSVDTTDGRVLCVDGFNPDQIRVHRPSDDTEAHADRHGHPTATAPTDTEQVTTGRDSRILATAKALHRLAGHH